MTKGKRLDIIFRRDNAGQDPLAQLAEHLTFNQGVRSSNLRWITISGGVAHLGERLNGIQEVEGSIPFVSTTERKPCKLAYLADSQGFRFLS